LSFHGQVIQVLLSRDGTGQWLQHIPGRRHGLESCIWGSQGVAAGCVSSLLHTSRHQEACTVGRPVVIDTNCASLRRCGHQQTTTEVARRRLLLSSCFLFESSMSSSSDGRFLQIAEQILPIAAPFTPQTDVVPCAKRCLSPGRKGGLCSGFRESWGRLLYACRFGVVSDRQHVG